MIALLVRYWLYVVITGVVLSGVLFFVSQQDQSNDWTTVVVERGDVTEVVSVSGFTEATNVADLGFPTVGIVSGIFATEGLAVETGALLASVGSQALVSQRQQAVATLKTAEATRAELLAGPTSESRAVTETTVTSAETAYQQTVSAELTKIRNAELALRSNDLTAYATDPEEEAAAPTVSGTYTCEEEGVYELSVYSSETRSGYSFNLSGLESGIYSAAEDQPGAFGDCGLSLQFVDGEPYTQSEWIIPVPNTRSNTYLTYKNAYELAVTQAEQNIAAAREAFRLAEDQATAANAAPRVEALLQANAQVQQAQASVAAIDAQLADRSIRAPFAGIVTDVRLVPGEVARTEPVITLLSEDAFTVTARVPEIDITKLTPGQVVRVNFDAKRDETLDGTVSFVSPLPTEIDGVAYFETLITLDTTPDWLKAGLNADIDIVVRTATDTLRLPERFLSRGTDNSYQARIPDDDSLTTQTVETGMRGNEGYIEVMNLEEGTTVVIP